MEVSPSKFSGMNLRFPVKLYFKSFAGFKFVVGDIPCLNFYDNMGRRRIPHGSYKINVLLGHVGCA